MKSHLSQDIKAALPLRSMAYAAMCAALLLVVQVALSGIANIELVSLLVMLFTVKFGRSVLYSIYVFALLEGLIYGYHIWWISYLYVWTILAGFAWLFRNMESVLGWSLLSGAFGLLFGTLCAIPYLFIGGVPMAVSYWISGIPFDLVHCVGNFLLCLFLWTPLRRIMNFIQ